MFSKKQLKSLSALKDKAADEITAEEIQAVNDELSSEGIELSVYAGTGPRFTQQEFDDAVASAATNSSATIKDLNTKVSDLTSSVAEKDKEIARLTALANGDEAPEKKEDKAHEQADKKVSKFDSLKEEAQRVASIGANHKKQ